MPGFDLNDNNSARNQVFKVEKKSKFSTNCLHKFPFFLERKKYCSALSAYQYSSWLNADLKVILVNQEITKWGGNTKTCWGKKKRNYFITNNSWNIIHWLYNTSHKMTFPYNEWAVRYRQCTFGFLGPQQLNPPPHCPPCCPSSVIEQGWVVTIRSFTIPNVCLCFSFVCWTRPWDMSRTLRHGIRRKKTKHQCYVSQGTFLEIQFT